MEDKKNYEEYFEEYKTISEALKDDQLSLDQAIKSYKRSKELYKKLKDILDNSKLEIEEIKE